MAPWLPLILTAGVGALTVLGSYLAARLAARAANKTADANVQNSINDGFRAMTVGFKEELAAAKSEIVELRGWIRDLIQHIESLEALLRPTGLDVPQRRFPHALALVPPPAPPKQA